MGRSFSRVEVTDLSNNREDDDNEQETSEMQFEDLPLKSNARAFASQSKAKAKPQRRSSACSSTKTIPIGERHWTDIEPEDYSDIFVQYCAYEPCGCGAVMCFVHSAGSLVWPRWFRHRTLHFMILCAIAETQKLSAATGFIPAVSSCPGALGHPNNVWTSSRIDGYVIDAFYNERWAC